MLYKGVVKKHMSVEKGKPKGKGKSKGKGKDFLKGKGKGQIPFPVLFFMMAR